MYTVWLNVLQKELLAPHGRSRRNSFIKLLFLPRVDLLWRRWQLIQGLGELFRGHGHAPGEVGLRHIQAADFLLFPHAESQKCNIYISAMPCEKTNNIYLSVIYQQCEETSHLLNTTSVITASLVHGHGHGAEIPVPVHLTLPSYYLVFHCHWRVEYFRRFLHIHPRISTISRGLL